MSKTVIVQQLEIHITLSAAGQGRSNELLAEKLEWREAYTLQVEGIVIISSLFCGLRENMWWWNLIWKLHSEVDFVSNATDIWTDNNMSHLGVSSSPDQLINFGAQQK